MARRPLAESRDDRSAVERAVDLLELRGCPATEAPWLARALMDPAVLPAENSETPDGDLKFPAEARLGYVASHFKDHRDRGAAILFAVGNKLAVDEAYVRQANYGPWEFFETEALALLVHCRDQGVDFSKALKSAGASLHRLPRIASLLHRADALKITDILDWSKVVAFGQRPGWWPSENGSLQVAADDADPTTLVFWLEAIGGAALDFALPHVDAAQNEGVEPLIRVARGIGRAIGAHMVRPRDEGMIGTTWYFKLGEEFNSRIRRVFDALDSAVGDSPAKAAPALREIWLRYAWMAFDQREQSIPEALRKRVYLAAADEIGRMRPLFRRASEPSTATEFRELGDHYSCCVHLVLILGTLWQGMKPLLLAFCSLRAQAVADDLRYWHESHRDGPQRPAWMDWSVIPMNIVAAVHNFSGREQEAGDPDLLDARSEFGQFCLDRLKPAKRRASGGDAAPPLAEGYAPHLAEPDPNWRECMIRALRELRVNPGGTGHQVLFHAKDSDPDEGVREAARIAYAELRAGWGSVKRISPRTLLLRAFAWVRQGHLLSLGITPDPAGVQRTRDEERRRTTEPDPDPGV